MLRPLEAIKESSVVTYLGGSASLATFNVYFIAGQIERLERERWERKKKNKRGWECSTCKDCFVQVHFSVAPENKRIFYAGNYQKNNNYGIV